jgi:hypothetical protein
MWKRPIVLPFYPVYHPSKRFEGVAQVVDDLGNPLVFTAREVLGHSSQLASICLSTAGFVALLNTVITPITPHSDGHTSALLGHEHGTLECTRIAKGDCARGSRWRIEICLITVASATLRSFIRCAYFFPNASFRSFASRTPALANC